MLNHTNKCLCEIVSWEDSPCHAQLAFSGARGWRRTFHLVSQWYDSGTLELDTCFAIWQRAKPKSLWRTTSIQTSGENYTWSRCDWFLPSFVCGFGGGWFLRFVGACFCWFLFALYSLDRIMYNRLTLSFSDNFFPNSGWLPTYDKKTPPLLGLQVLTRRTPYSHVYIFAWCEPYHEEGWSLTSMFGVRKKQYLCMLFGVLFFSTHLNFPSARTHFLPRKGPEKKSFPHFMNQRKIVS